MKKCYLIQIGGLCGSPDGDLVRLFKKGHSAYRFRGQGIGDVLVSKGAFGDDVGLRKPFIHITPYHTFETVGPVDGCASGEYVSGKFIPYQGVHRFEGRSLYRRPRGALHIPHQ